MRAVYFMYIYCITTNVASRALRKAFAICLLSPYTFCFVLRLCLVSRFLSLSLSLSLFV